MARVRRHNVSTTMYRHGSQLYNLCRPQFLSVAGLSLSANSSPTPDLALPQPEAEAAPDGERTQHSLLGLPLLHAVYLLCLLLQGEGIITVTMGRGVICSGIRKQCWVA